MDKLIIGSTGLCACDEFNRRQGRLRYHKI